MPIVICEGIDKIGKSTLCRHLTESEGYGYMHFSKPEGSNDRERALYQKGTFDRMFRFMASLAGQPAKVVMDRGHLGELVYGPLYRTYSGLNLEYIHELEAINPFDDVLLVMLVHRQLEAVRARDDGLGFDIQNLEAEQGFFELAFERSRLRHKVKIDVTRLDVEGAKASLQWELDNFSQWETGV